MLPSIPSSTLSCTKHHNDRTTELHCCMFLSPSRRIDVWWSIIIMITYYLFFAKKGFLVQERPVCENALKPIHIKCSALLKLTCCWCWCVCSSYPAIFFVLFNLFAFHFYYKPTKLKERTFKIKTWQWYIVQVAYRLQTQTQQMHVKLMHRRKKGEKGQRIS